MTRQFVSVLIVPHHNTFTKYPTICHLLSPKNSLFSSIKVPISIARSLWTINFGSAYFHMHSNEFGSKKHLYIYIKENSIDGF